MTNELSEVARDAITALDCFLFTDVDTTLLLLGSWSRSSELTVPDIRAVVAHYRTVRAAPPFEATPVAVAMPIVVATLRELDPAPAGAVRGNDHDGDDWSVRPDGQWLYEPNGMVRGLRRLVRSYGPISWYDASDNLIAVSHPDGQR